MSEQGPVPSVNLAVLAGVLSSEPRHRTLPSGSPLINYEVTTADADGRRRSVPVVWLDARQPPSLAQGDCVVVVGAVRRRFFRSGGATVSRTEVDAVVVARSSTARARRGLDEARAALGATAPLG